MSGAGGKPGGASGEGGVSPEQMSLAMFTGGEGLEKNAATFGKAGTGLSTMKTMADAGTMNKEALDLQQMSQADTQAQNAFNQANKSALTSGIGGIGSSIGNLGSSVGGSV